MKTTKLKKMIQKCTLYEGKMDAAISDVVKVITLHSPVFPDVYRVNVFPGDGIGIMPEHLLESDCRTTYVHLDDVINAIENDILMDENWWLNNRSL